MRTHGLTILLAFGDSRWLGQGDHTIAYKGNQAGFGILRNPAESW